MKTAKLFFAIPLFYLCTQPIFANHFPDSKTMVSIIIDQEDSEKITSYVDKFKHIAIAEMDRTNIPASIKMAQGILESGIGVSELATKANNHFGIKCGGDWTGKTYYVWDDEPTKSCFRVYDSSEQSYIAHSEFLRNPKKESRYGFLFKLDKTDYKAWAKGLQSSGYATSKTYATKLIELIEKYELFKLDHLSLRTSAISQAESDEIFEWQKEVTGDNNLKRPVIDPTLAQNDPLKGNTGGSTKPSTTTGTNTNTVWYNWLKSTNQLDKLDKVFTVNGLKVVIAKESDNLKTLAKRTNLKSRKVSRYNELKGRALKPYQYIYMGRKKKKSANIAKHTVKEGESLYDICQMYGIRYRRLQLMNLSNKTGALRAGTQIRLK